MACNCHRLRQGRHSVDMTLLPLCFITSYLYNRQGIPRPNSASTEFHACNERRNALHFCAIISCRRLFGTTILAHQ